MTTSQQLAAQYVREPSEDLLNRLGLAVVREIVESRQVGEYYLDHPPLVAKLVAGRIEAARDRLELDAPDRSVSAGSRR